MISMLLLLNTDLDAEVLPDQVVLKIMLESMLKLMILKLSKKLIRRLVKNSNLTQRLIDSMGNI